MSKYPVIDGPLDCGGSIYGHATTPRGAMRVARRYFVDGVARVEMAEWTPHVPAWLAISIPCAEALQS